jgi:hypothetical protein
LLGFTASAPAVAVRLTGPDILGDAGGEEWYGKNGLHDAMCRRTVFTHASRIIKAKSDTGGKKFDSLKPSREARSTLHAPRMSSDISVKAVTRALDMRCVPTRAVRPAGACLSLLNLSSCLYLACGQIDGRLLYDKQLSSCAVGVDLGVGSGYSARLVGWRLVYPLTEG